MDAGDEPPRLEAYQNLAPARVNATSPVQGSSRSLLASLSINSWQNFFNQ
ncbi:hypothetical protein Krac_4642 [Ktedonobacter racemifer DSM 44963]|uniref:Uncharacterized protein n=1 Tax=Ktedonobacter racemifer DSM 44963 TaxID=485913 RepID=D6TT99_KTERA|nr:hypothetical protein Krac_4642 [Ktedonobacter racemifer DSM 44963]